MHLPQAIYYLLFSFLPTSVLSLPSPGNSPSQPIVPRRLSLILSTGARPVPTGDHPRFVTSSRYLSIISSSPLNPSPSPTTTTVRAIVPLSSSTAPVIVVPDPTTTTTTSVSSSSPPPPPANPSGVPGSIEFLALKAHNDFRALHNASALSWDPVLAAAAQTWGDGCMFKHSDHTLGPWGENLAAMSGTTNTITNGIQLWINEAPDYTPSNPNYSHFTQMVWKSTTALGCSVSICPAGSIFPANYGPASYYVCEYNPMGNIYPASYFLANVSP